MKTITQDTISAFLYCAVTGVITSKKTGRAAGKADAKGYLLVCHERSSYRAHRLAWAIYHGSQPNMEIDHINGNPSDNRIENLRLADDFQNSRNQKRSAANRSGVKGIGWAADKGLWRARIRSKGICLCVKHFENIEDAKIYIQEQREILHGCFARHE